MIIDLGCGRNKHKGAIGVDNVKLETVDIVHDLLDFPYPFENESAQCVILSHVLEHFSIDDIAQIMNEVYRILARDGEVIISVPHAFSAAAFGDPTHKSFFIYNSFYFFTSNYQKAYYKVLNPQWQINRLWTTVNLFNDSFKPVSKSKQKLNSLCTKILMYFLKQSKSLTSPDLIVKLFPFWLVNIHCRLTKANTLKI